MATLITPHGQVSVITPANGRTFSLVELQTLVGGYIQVLSGPDGWTLFMNEDGKPLGLALNERATQMLAEWLMPGDVIVGNVVLCTAAEADGESCSRIQNARST